MLDNNEFVQDSIGINLYYLRTVRLFCLNVELGLPDNYNEYKIRLGSIGEKCENLGRRIVNVSNGILSRDSLTSNIFVTPYTLPLESLTEKLFNVSIATDITQEELELSSGTPTKVTDEFVKDIENFNNEALMLVEKFSNLIEEILNKVNNQDMFSYIFPSYLNFMIYETSLFINQLNRINQRQRYNPTFVITSELSLNNSMLTIAVLINKLVDPGDEVIADESERFVIAFRESEDLYVKTPITPDNQTMLTSRAINLVTDFSNFIRECIEKLLNKNTYFIIEPTFLDNMYTSVNYFLYMLRYTPQY